MLMAVRRLTPDSPCDLMTRQSKWEDE